MSSPNRATVALFAAISILTGFIAACHLGGGGPSILAVCIGCGIAFALTLDWIRRLPRGVRLVLMVAALPVIATVAALSFNLN